MQDIDAVAIHGFPGTSVFSFRCSDRSDHQPGEPAARFGFNALGTPNLLEALRASDEPLPLGVTSTNRVYGSLETLRLTAEAVFIIPVI